MRVVQLAGFLGPYEGSFVPMLRSILRAALDRGDQATVVLRREVQGYDWADRLEAEGLDVRYLPSERRATAAAVRALVEECREPTVLHTHFTSFDLPALAAARRRPDVKVVWHVHSRLHPGARARVRARLKYGLLGSGVNEVLAVAPHLAADMRRRGARSARAFANGIDGKRFPPITPFERAQARDGFGVPDDALVLLHFGWDWHTKGGDLLLPAVKLLRDRGVPAVALVVAGDAGRVALSGAGQARALADALGIGPAVVVHPLTPDLRQLRAAADVFVSASRDEGMPLAAIEAILCGLPVVATDIPGHRSLCEGLRSCRLTAPDPAALADELAAPRPSEHEVEQSRDAVRERFDLAAWTERLLAVYDRLLASTPAVAVELPR